MSTGMEWEGRERRYQEALREAREAERVQKEAAETLLKLKSIWERIDPR